MIERTCEFVYREGLSAPSRSGSTAQSVKGATRGKM